MKSYYFKIALANTLLLVFYQSLFGQVPSGYYASAEGKTGASLKAALHNIIDNHREYSYNNLRDFVLKETDEDPANPDNVILLYTGRSQSKNSFGGGRNDWNREHVWAKSHGDFGTRPPAGTDAHHIRPTDASVNSNRGSKDFDNGGSPQGEASGTYTDSDSWEPRDAVKGDVARMMFYMSTRYEGGSGEPDLELIDRTNSAPRKQPLFGKVSTLIAWHKLDPVDDYERRRNEVIYGYQGNRNPFIDHPEWVSCIWEDACSGSGGGNPATPPVSYCSSTATEKDEYIDRFRLNGIDNSSGDDNGYGDYTGSSTTTLVKGQPYSLRINAAWSGDAYKEGYTVWVDFNKDGDFEDSNEKVFSKEATTSSLVSGSFTVPRAASLGETRLRVKMRYNTAPNTPCGTYRWGEVEDYKVQIVAAAPRRLKAEESALKELNPSEVLMTLSPNPLKVRQGSYRTKLHLTTKTTPFQITVHNPQGQLVYHKEGISQGNIEEEIVLNEMKSGLYWVGIQTKDGYYHQNMLIY